jgi:GAF domain-containing protein
MAHIEKYKKRFLILQDISSAVVISDSVITLTDYLLDVAIKHVDAGTGSLMLANERGVLSLLSSRGLDPEFARSFGFHGTDPISGTVLRTREPVLVRDITQHPEFYSPDRHHYRTGSFISCPILFRDRLLGILNVSDRKNGSPFTHDDLDLLQVIANNAAVALENASLVSRLKTTAADLERANRRLIDADIMKTEFLTGVSHELRTPLNAIRGAIYYLTNHNAASPEERHEFHDIIAAEARNLAGTIDGLIRFLEAEDESLVLERSPVNVADVLGVLPAGQLRSVFSSRGIRFSLVPVPDTLWIVGDKVRISQVFTHLLVALAHHLSADDAIELSASNSREGITFRIDLSRPLPRSVLQQLNSDTSLYPSGSSDDRVRFYLARSMTIAHHWAIAAENLATSSRVVITCPPDRSEALKAYIAKSISLFVDSVSEALDVNICSVMLTDDLTGELRVACARGLDDKVIKTTSIKPGDRIAGWVALEGKPLFISDVEVDSRFLKKNISQYNNKSLMSFPLKIDDRVIGVLNLNSKKSSQPFSQQDFERALSLIASFSSRLRHVYTDQHKESDILQMILSLDSSAAAHFKKPDHNN